MRVTVVPEDKMVIVDGVARQVTMPAFPNIRAVQWEGDRGRIEYYDREPTWFKDFAKIQPAVDAWEAAAPGVEPPLPRTISREALVDRMTNVELAAFVADREAWTLRQREKFLSILQLEEGTPAWTVLATKLEGLFGRARATELLA